MAMTEEEKKQIIEEVLYAIQQYSTGIEDLETVSSLTGVKTLPGQKEDTLVNVPVELISKPATDAADKANAAALKAEGAISGLDEKTAAAEKAAADANAAAAKAEEVAEAVETSTEATLSGATARFSAWVDTGEVKPVESIEPGGRIVYVASAKRFAYEVGGSLYGDWDVEGMPPPDMYMNTERTAVLPDKLYMMGSTVYTASGGELKIFAHRHEILSEDEYEALAGKDENTLYLVYEEG